MRRPRRSFDDLPDILTIPEVAAFLRIGRNPAYDAAQRGEIPTIQLGRRKIVSKASLGAMLGIDYGQNDKPPP